MSQFEILLCVFRERPEAKTWGKVLAFQEGGKTSAPQMTDLTTILAAILAAVVAIGTAWLRGKATGQRQEQDKRARQDLDAVRKAKDVQDEIDRQSPDDVRRRLDGWMRADDD